MSNPITEDFLVEIGTEELPPKSLYSLASNLSTILSQELTRLNLAFDDISFFATPRRLAVWVKQLSKYQPDQVIEKTGPSQAAAYDSSGNPTSAALGFAKSCGVSLSEIGIQETQKGKFLHFSTTVPGQSIIDLAATLLNKAIKELPIAKPMTWGMHSQPFIRPVQWVLVMYGQETLPCTLFDLDAGDKTYGHRFHAPAFLEIKHPKDYQKLLAEKGFVQSDYQQRKENIRQQINTLANPHGRALIDEDLLEEVNSLVEWPIAMMGQFDARFLKVPKEALISSMKYHQKSFPVVDDQNQLLPLFITIANIESKQPEVVVHGNEKVMKARLADAEFFYHTDLKLGLTHYLSRLKTVLFQKKLGMVYEKAERIAQLAKHIGSQIGCDAADIQRAGLLCKADLATEMVGEFPELQGIMGYYYALAEKESSEVALAIKEHYLPRFAGDVLPSSLAGCAVALADKLDTLVGIFGINQAPTGEKDPFGLRRAGLGILRLLIENKLHLDLQNLVKEAVDGYAHLENETVKEDSVSFIMERLRSWYMEKGVTPDVFASVFARYPTSPYDFDQRIQAIQYFQQLPEAKALAAANKRVSNLLKQTAVPAHLHFNHSLFQIPAEKILGELIEQQAKEIEQLCAEFEYQQALKKLATLKEPVDAFFDHVMVMVEDEGLKNNRLILLNNLRQMFLQIADISLLQS